ncbi:MAG: hypothetical protein ABIN89_30160 [Chitinophagaceae bacterium]
MIDTGMIKKIDEFYWLPNQQLTEPRCFENQVNRNIEWVAEEEIELAILLIVKKSFTISIDQLNSEVSRRLGFNSTTVVKRIILDSIKKSVEKGVLQKSDEDIISYLGNIVLAVYPINQLVFLASKPLWQWIMMSLKKRYLIIC